MRLFFVTVDESYLGALMGCLTHICADARMRGRIMPVGGGVRSPLFFGSYFVVLLCFPSGGGRFRSTPPGVL